MMRICATFSQTADCWCLCFFHWLWQHCWWTTFSFIHSTNMSTSSSVGCGHVCGPAPLHWKLFCAAGKLEEGLKIKITLQPPFDNQSNQGGVSVSGCWIVEIIMIRGHLTTKTTHRVEVLKDVTTCAERLFVGWLEVALSYFALTLSQGWVNNWQVSRRSRSYHKRRSVNRR